MPPSYAMRFDRSFMVIATAANGLGVALESTRLAQREIAEGRLSVPLPDSGIRETLQLNRPIYARTSAYGHFGRAPEADGGFSWEKTDLIDALKAAV